jgi:hypothetical protein
VYSESFKGLNDLHFAMNGDLYFTDQGQTGCIDPTGRVFALTCERCSGSARQQCTGCERNNIKFERQTGVRRGNRSAADMAVAAYDRRFRYQEPCRLAVSAEVLPVPTE